MVRSHSGLTVASPLQWSHSKQKDSQDDVLVLEVQASQASAVRHQSGVPHHAAVQPQEPLALRRGADEAELTNNATSATSKFL